MIQDLIKNSKVIICVGSGGVGKTTLAAALGFFAATKGKRVLVLTIDPSQRLKTTLGLDELGQITKIPHQKIDAQGGSFCASVIDAKKTFDDFVKRAAIQPELAEKILNNKLYIQLSTTLSGSQEFTALEKLYSSCESGDYDLVILDTPPTKHAIDFLLAPQKLSSLFNEGVASWFRDPEGKEKSFFKGLLQTGTKQVLKVLETLTGSEFMHELSDFFQNIQAWQSKLESRVHTVHQLLVNPATQFFLVTSFDEAKLKEAEYFSREIRKGGYHLQTIIINRAFPSWFHRQSDDAIFLENNRRPLVELYLSMKKYFQERNQKYLGFANRMKKDCDVYQIPELENDISDIRGVELISDIFEKEFQK